ncbi:MAG: copper amine oxidase N-terminal domain-containing protein [Firmicutes bacterium]|nr:copper amine oxidase N-terminal domain-containing protein [Bacillota bacterium]
MKLRKANKAVSILVTLAMLIGLLLPAGSAFAATDNYAVSVPKVQADSDDVTLGTLVIREDDDSDGAFQDGDRVTVTLPDGVEFAEEPSVANAIYYVDTTAVGLTWDIVAAADNYITVEANGTDTNGSGESKLFFYFNEAGLSAVDIDDDVTGDIKVEIDAAGTSITSEFVTVARIIDGDTKTTISSVEDLAIDSTGPIGTIKIAENAAGVLDPAGSSIKLVLPNDFKWDMSTIVVSASGLTLDTTLDTTAEYAALTDDKTLEVKLSGSKSSGQPGFITVKGEIIVPDDADEGDVEMTVKGNEVTEEDVVIAKVGDFGFKVEVDGDIETIVAGKEDQDVADIIIDEIVADSWIAGRYVHIDLPSWAEWNTLDNEAPLQNGSKDSDDPEKSKYQVATSPSGKAELKDLTVNIDADAPEGDLVAKIYGSAGVEAEVVIAKIVKPFTVTADKPEVVLGVQNQKLGDITITETEDEAVNEDKWIILQAPVGFSFDQDPDVEVTAGTMDIDNDDTDGRYFAFEVTGESSKPSTIKISNISFDVDRTVPVGDITFKVYMTKNGLSSLNFDDAIDKDNYEDVTNVVVGTIVNPAPAKGSVLFNIGSSVYTVDSVTKVMDAAPYIKNGRTYVPVRYLALALGVTEENIGYENGVVTLVKGDTTLKLTMGSTTLTKNDTAVTMDVAPETVNGRTMLPARFVAEAFGALVGYANGQVVISMQ